MPGRRENFAKTIAQNAEKISVKKSNVTKDIDKQPSNDSVYHIPEGYSARSSVAKAYRVGQMPVDHRRLLDAIKEVLGDGVTEGAIHLEDVLQATGYLRASALKMLRHMQNFGVLETKSGYRQTWVKILRD